MRSRRRGAPSRCPKGLDALAYASGYIEGKAPRAKRPLRLSESQEGRSMIRGYARVSTDGQSIDAQLKQLCAACSLSTPA